MDINLVLFKKNGSRKMFPLPSSVTVIGRRHSCDLRIPLTSVSKKHCQLTHNNGVLKIRDLGSRNGTILNNKRIDEAVIQANDSIKIGPLTFLFQIDGYPKDIIQPAWATRNLSQHDIPTKDTTTGQFSDITGLDDLDSSEETAFV